MAYKLHYFEIKGGAELSRLMFALKDIKYEDIRIKQEDWPSRKGEYPLGALPVLEVDGKQFCQSAAIERYLARKFDIYGKDDMERLIIDEIKETIVDMSKGIGAIYGEKDEQTKKKMMRDNAKDTFPKFIPLLVKRVKEAKGKFLFGDEISLGDLYIYRSLEFLKDFAKSAAKVDDYDWTMGSDILKKHCDKVEAVPNIAKWIKNRPQSEM